MADTQRIAIVTGASRGIGRSIAMRLAESGLAVIVNYSGAAEDADDVVRAIQAVGGRGRAVRADVSVAGEVGRLFDDAEQAFGGADVLVNNAGVMTPGPLAEATPWRSTLLPRRNRSVPTGPGATALTVVARPVPSCRTMPSLFGRSTP